MERLEKLRKSMAERSIDLVCLGPGSHLAWLLGVHPHADERPLLFCVTLSGQGFLVPALEANSLRKYTDFSLHEWDDADGPNRALDNLLGTIGADMAQNIALDETMRADFAALVQDKLTSAKRQFCASTVGALRMRKDENEYQLLKKNAAIADAAMQTAWSTMQSGMRENEVGETIKKSFISQGAQPLFGIVASGQNGASPHHQTGETFLKTGDAVVMDIGGTQNGYTSDITRMAVIGHPPEGFQECCAIVDEAVETALEAARPGVRAQDVDKAARDVIAKAGYGEYFVHRTGHGLGTEVHEPPYITETADDILEEGMVFSIEPGIYIPQRFGIRLEEIIILRDNGPEILSQLPRDVRVIDD